MIWSNGSFRPLNDSSCGRQNFRDQGHSRTFAVKGKSVILTIPSKFRSVFSLIAFLSSSISFLISLRRPEFTSSEEFNHQLSSLLWLSSSLFLLVPTLVGEQFSSCCSCSLISWFYLVSSSTLAIGVWICKANATEFCGVLNSIWISEPINTTISNESLNFSSP